MKKNIGKKLLSSLMVSLSIIGCAVPVMADTSFFDITVPGDIKSKRTIKADNEQRYYVTGTYFNKKGSLSCTSINLNNSNIESYTMTITDTYPANIGEYDNYAPYNQYYYLLTAASVNNFHVKGRYTP